MVEYQDRFVSVNGLKLHYAAWDGPADAPPLVLLHGVTGNAHQWDHFAPAFANRFRPLAFDLRGFGDSEWSPDGKYGSVDLAADLAGVFADLQLRRAVIVGASWGGLIGLMHAADHPESVSKLVLVDIGFEFSQPETAIPDRRWEFDSPADLEQFERGVSKFPALWTMRPYIRHELREQAGKWARKTDPAFRQRWPFRNRAYWEYARQVRCPALLIRGAESPVLSPELAARSAASIAGCRFVEVPHAGHSVHLDNPPAFEAALRSFLT